MAARSPHPSFNRVGLSLTRAAVCLAMLAANPLMLAGQTQWQFVGSEIEQSDGASSAVPRAQAPRVASETPGLKACGEVARSAGEPFRSIVGQLVEASGVSAQVYESVAHTSPHARAGGCVFYNRAELSALFQRWLKLSQPELVEPMLYAIFAHELGHLAHNDFSKERAQVAPMTRELEADRFAGYMLSRLNIRVDDLTDYYRLTGDDFTGIRHDHGVSGQRAEAFALGWRRAELGLIEQSAIGVGSTDHP